VGSFLYAYILVYTNMKKLELDSKFFQKKFVENLSKTQIQVDLNLSDNQYFYLLEKCKRNRITEITTNFLESELIEKYEIANKDEQKDLLKYMIEIWKFKHKIPREKKDEPTEVLTADAESLTN